MGEPASNGQPEPGSPENGKNRRATAEHDEHGRFAKGNTLCRKGGRRPGTPNIMTAARRFAKSRGMSLGQALEHVLAAAYDAALSGEKDRMSGAKLFLERTVGPVLRDAVNVQVNQAQQQGGAPAPTGPQPPQGKELLEWAKQLQRLAEEQIEEEETDDDGKNMEP